ncbi:ComGF family competence protein [Bacillus pacificus]
MSKRTENQIKGVYLFVGQVQLEFREVSFVEKIVPENRESMLRFRLRTGDEVTYEKLNNHLIRKVNMRGREVILQNIEMVSYEVTPHLLFINVKDRSGKIYEGVAIRYSEMGIHV